MIPAIQPYIAWFGAISFPVVAWDDDGTPMVMPSHKKRLCRADEFNDFSGVDPAPRSRVLPGQGWTVTWSKSDPAGRFTEPVLGWLISEDGTRGSALSADEDGDVCEVDDKDAVVLPPGVDPEEYLARQPTAEVAR